MFWPDCRLFQQNASREGQKFKPVMQNAALRNTLKDACMSVRLGPFAFFAFLPLTQKTYIHRRLQYLQI